MFHWVPRNYNVMVNQFVDDMYDVNLETINLEYLTDQIAQPIIDSLKQVA